MRTLNELYLILYEQIKDKNYIIGLCREINDLHELGKIVTDEYFILHKHLNSQKPSTLQHAEFIQSKTWKAYGLFWWTCDEDDNPVNRKAFIQKMIEIT